MYYYNNWNTDAKFIILTNGIIYKFFSDIDTQGKLDNEPFFVFNLLDFKESQIETLMEFSKENFDIDKAAPVVKDVALSPSSQTSTYSANFSING